MDEKRSSLGRYQDAQLQIPAKENRTMSANIMRWLLTTVATFVFAMESARSFAIAQEEGTIERRVRILDDDLVRASDLGIYKTTIQVKVPENHALLLFELTYRKTTEHPAAKAVSVDYCWKARLIERSLIVMDPTSFLNTKEGKLQYRLPSGTKGEALGVVAKLNTHITSPHSHDPQLLLEFEVNQEQSPSSESWQRIAVYAQFLDIKDVATLVAHAADVVDQPSGAEHIHGYYTLDTLPAVIEQSEAKLQRHASLKQSK